jgi:hypothetical protein
MHIAPNPVRRLCFEKREQLRQSGESVPLARVRIL